jgi:hypothetical protein
VAGAASDRVRHLLVGGKRTIHPSEQETNLSQRSRFTNPTARGLTTESGSERREVIPPIRVTTEILNQQNGGAGANSPPFEDCGRCPMEQLVAERRIGSGSDTELLAQRSES